MTNTRMSWDTAFSEQDMITQIMIMKDKVATGTYASVTASAGTGTDAGKIVFTFTDQEGTATVFKITAKTISSIASSQSGSTVTMTVTFNDGTSQTITWTAGGDVTTDTAQTISGTKTFTADQIFSGDVSFIDVVISGQAQLGDNLAIEDSGSDSVLSSGGAIKLTGSYATSNNRAYTSAGSSDVLVKAHVADMPVVHLTGNETVAGAKSFTNIITCGDVSAIQIHDTRYTYDEVPTTVRNRNLVILDYSGTSCAGLFVKTLTTGVREIWGYCKNCDGTYRESKIL